MAILLKGKFSDFGMKDGSIEKLLAEMLKEIRDYPQRTEPYWIHVDIYNALVAAGLLDPANPLFAPSRPFPT